MARTFQWTEQKRQALDLCTAWGVSQRQIAERIGTTRRTVEGWVRRPAFRAELEARYAAIRANNDAFLAQMRAESEQKQREHEQRMQEMRATMHAETAAWLAWKGACHQARRAHRKLPPKPAGIQ